MNFCLYRMKDKQRAESVCVPNISEQTRTMLDTSASANIYSCGKVWKCKACRRKSLFKLATFCAKGTWRLGWAKGSSAFYALLPSFIVLVPHWAQRNGLWERHLYQAKLACSIAGNLLAIYRDRLLSAEVRKPESWLTTARLRLEGIEPHTGSFC